MAITITTDTIVKIIVRNGTTSDRIGIILSQGELGYATDQKRLFVGDGVTAGGNSVGTTNWGVNTNYYNLSAPISQTGDIVSDGTTIYSYTSGGGWLPVSFNPNTQFDNATIVNIGGLWQLNTAYLSGGSAYINAISAVQTLSGNWTTAYNELQLQPYSVYANTTPNAGNGNSLTIKNGQFLGNINSTLSSVNVVGLNGINTYPAALGTGTTNYYIDGSPIQTSISAISAAVATAQYDLNDIGTQFYNETSFVYSVDTHKGTAGISNMWQNVFADQNCTPLRVAVTTGSRQRVVRVEGRLNCRQGNNATSNWARLGIFPTLTPTIADMTTWRGNVGSRSTFPLLAPPYNVYTPSTAPINVLDVATWEGHAGYSQNTSVYLNGYYTIPANTTIIFGLQTFIFSGVDGNTGWFELNGWQTGAQSDGQDGPRNLLGFTGGSNTGANTSPTQLPNYAGYYAWGEPYLNPNNVFQYNNAPGSSPAAPQTQLGISNPGENNNTAFRDMSDIFNPDGSVFQSQQWGVKNTSYIRAVFIS